jgi:hexosaminidase
VRLLWHSAGFLLLLLAGSLARSQISISLMPMPAGFRLGSGRLLIDQSFSITLTGKSGKRLEHAAHDFLGQLSKRTGIPLAGKLGGGSNATLVIRVEQQGKKVQQLGENESYELGIQSSGARLTAPTDLGALHGLQTFLQLLEISSDGFVVPEISIHDAPRFPWRGLMIDVSRHFIPLEVLKRNLDGMASLKMNVLHWHLSDNQGFRVESKKFPKLEELGSDGLYYTQDDVRELIAYAYDRGIRVIPEFDMPGHSTAWLVGYPELASGPGPYQIERKWGVFDPAMDPTQEKTYKFLDEFIAEMAQLFPDQFFHIGGDEVNGKQWDENPRIQRFKSTHGMKANEDLQAYFNKRVQAILNRRKKIMIGWDEILNPDLPKQSVVQSWRGQQSLAVAAQLGYRGILSYGYYLDLMWPAWRHYAMDPLGETAALLSSDEKQRIIGGEACMWSEYVSAENIDSRIWPRAAAIAERLWSPQQVEDLNSMYQRLAITSARLDWLGLTHNSYYPLMLRRIAGRDDIAALETLADVVEPVKDYTREATAAATPTSATPLNRLVDAARPESDLAREFAHLIDAFVAGQSDDAQTREQIRSRLRSWRDNHAKLRPVFEKSFLLQEVVPISQNLSALGSGGLAAMDYLDAGQPAPESWKNQQLTLIEEARGAKAQLMLPLVPSVEKLVEAATKPRNGLPANE